MEPEHHIANLRELACAQCECVLSAGKCADGMYGNPREGALDPEEHFQRKRHKVLNLRCPLSTWQRFHDEQKPQR